MIKPLVLIVEDEAPLVTMLRYNLENEGFHPFATEHFAGDFQGKRHARATA